MSDIRPNPDPTFDLDGDDTAVPDGPVPDDGMREMPTDPPSVVPSVASEQTVVAAGMGLAGFAQADPEAGLTGEADESWKVDRNETQEEA